MLLKREAIHEQEGLFPRRDRRSGGEDCMVEGRAVRKQLGGSRTIEVGGLSGCRGASPSPEVIVLSSSDEELDDPIDVEVVMPTIDVPPTKPAMESNKIPPRKAIRPVIKNYTRQAAFQSAELKKEFKRSFKKPRASPGLSQTALEKKAREILHDMTRPARQAVRASQVAWNQAAMKWREKNRPSSEAVLRRRQEDAARAQQSSKQRAFNSPFSRAYASDEPSTVPEANVKPPLQRPPPDAPEIEWRSYYRQVIERKIEHANSFADILRVLHVPCEDSTRVKDAYRLAVRMYHPDSNSKEKVWNTEKEKIQAEEVLKIINERKPPDT
jgi:hypothetical protein